MLKQNKLKRDREIGIEITRDYGIEKNGNFFKMPRFIFMFTMCVVLNSLSYGRDGR